MADIAALTALRGQRFFEAWDGHVPAKNVAASEASVGRLIDELIALGPAPTEKAARRAVAACVRRFNKLDDGWICTIEREDICEQIETVVELCGFECDEDWIDRDW